LAIYRYKHTGKTLRNLKIGFVNPLRKILTS